MGEDDDELAAFLMCCGGGNLQEQSLKTPQEEGKKRVLGRHGSDTRTAPPMGAENEDVEVDVVQGDVIAELGETRNEGDECMTGSEKEASGSGKQPMYAMRCTECCSHRSCAETPMRCGECKRLSM